MKDEFRTQEEIKERIIFLAGFKSAEIYHEQIEAIKIAEEGCRISIAHIQEYLSTKKGIERTNYLYSNEQKKDFADLGKTIKKDAERDIEETLEFVRDSENLIDKFRSCFLNIPDYKGKSSYESFDKRLKLFNEAHTKLCEYFIYDLGWRPTR